MGPSVRHLRVRDLAGGSLAVRATSAVELVSVRVDGCLGMVSIAVLGGPPLLRTIDVESCGTKSLVLSDLSPDQINLRKLQVDSVELRDVSSKAFSCTESAIADSRVRLSGDVAAFEWIECRGEQLTVSANNIGSVTVSGGEPGGIGLRVEQVGLVQVEGLVCTALRVDVGSATTVRLSDTQIADHFQLTGTVELLSVSGCRTGTVQASARLSRLEVHSCFSSAFSIRCKGALDVVVYDSDIADWDVTADEFSGLLLHRNRFDQASIAGDEAPAVSFHETQFADRLTVQFSRSCRLDVLRSVDIGSGSFAGVDLRLTVLDGVSGLDAIQFSSSCQLPDRRSARSERLCNPDVDSSDLVAAWEALRVASQIHLVVGVRRTSSTPLACISAGWSDRSLGKQHFLGGAWPRATECVRSESSVLLWRCSGLSVSGQRRGAIGAFTTPTLLPGSQCCKWTWKCWARSPAKAPCRCWSHALLVRHLCLRRRRPHAGAESCDHAHPERQEGCRSRLEFRLPVWKTVLVFNLRD